MDYIFIVAAISIYPYLSSYFLFWFVSNLMLDLNFMIWGFVLDDYH